jgi:hypothetical protein
VPPKAKVTTKTCRLIVRTIGGNREQCGIKYTTERCPEPDPHLKSMKTGACGINWCEGTKAKDWRGNPAPTCTWWETCPCLCHDLVSKMFAESGMDRIPVEISGYTVDRSQFWMPTDEDRAQWAAERAARSNATAPDAPIVIESPAPGIVPPMVTRSFGPTTTGRAARGELEAWVNKVCGMWLVEQYKFECTPLFISETIAKDEGIKAPSTGAITACLDKWAEIGYAVIARKPVRFVGYTPDGLQSGLEGIKDRYSRIKRTARQIQERGVLR